MLQHWKLRTHVANRRVRQIASNRSVRLYCELSEEANASELSLSDTRMRQLLTDGIKWLTPLLEQHVYDCFFKWREHTQRPNRDSA